MPTISRFLANPAETTRLGAAIGGYLRPGDVVGLSGPLGAGKTALARGVIGEFAGAKEVPSPTYGLVESYVGKRCALWHFDLYRLEKPEDVFELGFDDALAEGASLIEWPERIANLLPPDLILIRLQIAGAGRSVRIDGDRGWIPSLGPLAARAESSQGS